jgi:hypothetical protein
MKHTVLLALSFTLFATSFPAISAAALITSTLAGGPWHEGTT